MGQKLLKDINTIIVIMNSKKSIMNYSNKGKSSVL